MTQRHWYQARKKGAGDPEDGTIFKNAVFCRSAGT